MASKLNYFGSRIVSCRIKVIKNICARKLNAARDIIEKVLKYIFIPKILLIYGSGAKLYGPHRYSSAEVGKVWPAGFFKLIFCIFLNNFVYIMPCDGLKPRAFDCKSERKPLG